MILNATQSGQITSKNISYLDPKIKIDYDWISLILFSQPDEGQFIILNMQQEM